MLDRAPGAGTTVDFEFCTRLRRSLWQPSNLRCTAERRPTVEIEFDDGVELIHVADKIGGPLRRNPARKIAIIQSWPQTTRIFPWSLLCRDSALDSLASGSFV